MSTSQPPLLPLFRSDDQMEAIFAQAIPAKDVLQVVFPTEKARKENKVIGITSDGDPHILNPGDPQPREDSVYLAYYLYPDGERQHNITDWAVEQFREHYVDVAICQSDILYYVYAILHHPAHAPGEFIPMLDAFWKISDAGRALTALHLIPGDPEDIRAETERLAASLPG